MPQRKLDRFAELAHAARVSHDGEALQTAAGLLASFAPAVHMNRLLGQWLRQGDEGGALEGVLVGGVERRQFLAFWEVQLPRLNGKLWRAGRPWGSPPVDRVGHEQARLRRVALGERWQQSVPFSAAELELMQRREFSSTWREVRGFVVGLRGLLRSRPELAAGPQRADHHGQSGSVRGLLAHARHAHRVCGRLRAAPAGVGVQHPAGVCVAAAQLGSDARGRTR